MPTEPKPLFRVEALRPKLVGFGLPPGVGEARKKLGGWVNLLANKQAEAMKETELLPGFITDLFERLLGFAGPETGEATYTLKREALIKGNDKKADAALGRVAVGGDQPRFIAVVEGKGPRDPLDWSFAGCPLSAVDQALRYAVSLQCEWYLVMGLREIGVYHRGTTNSPTTASRRPARSRTIGRSGSWCICSERSDWRRRRGGAISTTYWWIRRRLGSI
jgi:hypothetical protein